MKTIISLSIAFLFSVAVTAWADGKNENRTKTGNKSEETVIPIKQLPIVARTIQSDGTQQNNKVTSAGDIKEWYIGPSFGHARMKDDKGTLIMGVQGGRIFNQRLVIGAAGFGFMNGEGSNNHNDFSGIRGGYGGLLVSPVFWGKRTFHLAVPLIIGGGGISNSLGDFAGDAVNSGYFIFVPGVELGVSIAKHFRLAATFNYRITSGLKWDDMGPGFETPASNYVNGPSINLILKFGNFITKK